MAPQAPNPWDKPHPMPTAGDATAEELFSAVGKALTFWEGVENALVQIFAKTSKIELRRAMFLYSSLSDSRTKQNAIAAAAKFEFANDSEGHDYHKAVMKLVQKFSERRNDIAHGIVGEVRGGDSYLLTGPFHGSRGFDHAIWQTKYAFRAEHIRLYAANFGYLKAEILDAMFWLDSKEPQPPSFETPLSRFLRPYQNALQNRGSRQQPLPPKPPSQE